jgi:hypothetical protein
VHGHATRATPTPTVLFTRFDGRVVEEERIPIIERELSQGGFDARPGVSQ